MVVNLSKKGWLELIGILASIIMASTSIWMAYSTSIQTDLNKMNIEQQSELLETELLLKYPYLSVGRECGPEVEDKIRIKAPIKNNGEIGVHILATGECIGFTCGDFKSDGIEVDLKNISSESDNNMFARSFVLMGGDEFENLMTLDTSPATKTENFTIRITYYAIDTEKATFETTNQIECSYKHNGTVFIPVKKDVFEVNQC